MRTADRAPAARARRPRHDWVLRAGGRCRAAVDRAADGPPGGAQLRHRPPLGRVLRALRRRAGGLMPRTPATLRCATPWWPCWLRGPLRGRDGDLRGRRNRARLARQERGGRASCWPRSSPAGQPAAQPPDKFWLHRPRRDRGAHVERAARARAALVPPPREPGLTLWRRPAGLGLPCEGGHARSAHRGIPAGRLGFREHSVRIHLRGRLPGSHAPTAVGVSGLATWSDPGEPGGKPKELSKIKVDFAPGARLNTAALPACKASDVDVQIRSVRACPRNTIVGSVRGQGLYPGSTPFYTYATLFNARRQIIVVVTLDTKHGPAADQLPRRRAPRARSRST